MRCTSSPRASGTSTSGPLTDTGRNYWDELSSGEQSDGLLITLESIGGGFSKAGWAAWDEIKQTPATLAELPGVYWDEVASGEQNERLWGYVTGMVDYGDEVMSTAADFYSDPNALQEAIDKHGRKSSKSSWPRPTSSMRLSCRRTRTRSAD